MKFKKGDRVKIINNRQYFYKSCLGLSVFVGKFIRYSATSTWAAIVINDGSKRIRSVFSKDLELAREKNQQLEFDFMI